MKSGQLTQNQRLRFPTRLVHDTGIVGYTRLQSQGVTRRSRPQPCRWCGREVADAGMGRRRQYCRQSCRQRAYEHRHGFEHRRTIRPLPGQVSGDVWSGTGYERGGSIAPFGKTHAMRTSVRPEGRRRETLCGVLVAPLNGQHFTPLRPRACKSCTALVDANPLRYGISASNELSRLRSLLDDIREKRIAPSDALTWIRQNSP